MDPQFTAQLSNALERLTQATDTQEIRSLTATLNKDFYSQPTCIPALTEIATRASAAYLRQLAAVELRKRILKQWSAVPPEFQGQIRQHLLDTVVQDPEAQVRHALARVISAVAQQDLPNNRWPNLLPFLFQLSTSAEVGHRETGIYVLYTLFEVIADGDLSATQQLPQLFNLFGTSIADPDSRTVRVTTIEALGKVAEFIEPENANDVKTFRELVPPMVRVLQDCLDHGDEVGASHGFDVFDTLLVLETPLLTKHFADLIQFFLAVGGNQEYPDSIRSQGLSFITMAATFKRSKLQKLKLVEPTIDKLFAIMAQAEAEDQAGEEDEDDDDCPARVALATLNSLAMNLPASSVFPPTMSRVLQCMQSSSPAARKAGMLAFAVIIEWSVELIADKVNDLIRLVVAGLQDPTIGVRRAACMALGAFAESFETEIADHHATLLPLIFELMNDSNVEVIKHSCNALDAILEGMGSDVVQYLPTLVQGLTHLLETGPTKVKLTVAAALGSAAHAAKADFLPYFDGIIQRLQQLSVMSTEEDDYSLRAIAIDTVGIVAEAVGKDVFRPYLEDFMKLALAGLELPSGRLRDCTFLFFGTISKVLGDDFAPYLQYTVPALLQSCQVDEAVAIEDVLNSSSHDDVDLGDDSDDHGDADEDDDPYYVSNAVAEEKEVAADVLGEVFENTRAHFLPYANAVVQELVKLTEHDSESVRTAVVSSLFKCLVTYHSITVASGSTLPWKAGLPPSTPMDANLAQLVQLIMPAVLDMWCGEYEASVVIQLFHELTQALKAVGPALLAFILPKPLQESHGLTPDATGHYIFQELSAAFLKTAPCQEDVDDEDNRMDDEEKAKRDALVVGGAADVAAALYAVIGPDFAQYFHGFFMAIREYYSPAHDVSERSMAIGCLGEAITGLKEGVAPMTQDLLALFLQALADTDAEVRSNAAFGLGVLVLYSPVDLTAQYPAILSGLHAIVSRKDQNATKNVLDNACGALARLSLKSPQAVPLAELVTTIVTHLPLEADFAENEPIYDLLCALVAENHPAVQSHLAQLKAVFQHVHAHASEQLQPEQAIKVQAVLPSLN
ncbi:hypothetical protein H4R35_002954 [Dimargaris xerosporica]|nr:hypothetical protein H4R35_002954 [Dimargaris xerosporica]